MSCASQRVPAHRMPRVANVQVVCYALTDQTSWWRDNITSTVVVKSLTKVDHPDAAAAIRADRIDVLIDLNGLTEGSGLGIMAHRPAPVQATFLGYVGTLNVPYVDYIFTDAVISPPELSSCYSEHMVRSHVCFVHGCGCGCSCGLAARFYSRAEG